MSTLVTVDFEPLGRRIQVPAGSDLLSAAQKAGVELLAACGGMGICGQCRVRLVQGRLSPLTADEEALFTPAERTAGLRLACQALAHSDVLLEVPPESLLSQARLQTEGHEARTDFDPAVRAVDLSLPLPSQQDLRDDLRRAAEALAVPLHTNLPALNALSRALRAQGGRVRLALRDEGEFTRLLSASAPETPPLGLAVDMGSTKLASFLIHLESGAVLGQAAAMNPQISYGEDVISRIAYANKAPENRAVLQTRLVESLNQLAQSLCAQAGAAVEQIVEGVLVGNTAIHHFLCGLPVEPLGTAPYIAAVSQPLDLPAEALGLHLAPGAMLHLPALIAGYVGADHTAALLASDFDAPSAVQVLVDIGTNTEISLSAGGQILTCSTASGPAFEGAHIHDGMRAAPGAVERVRWADGRAQVFTVGGKAPVGLCGTGILQAVAELYGAGILDQRGVFQRLPDGSRPSQLVLVPSAETGHGRDIVVTRKDVNEIQLAKGAIRAGIEILLAEAGLRAEDVQRWVIAGAFGAYLDLPSAVRLGMFPAVPLERFFQVGNAAGVGARQMLLSRTRRQQAAALPQRVRYIELTAYADFTRRFVQSMYFGSV